MAKLTRGEIDKIMSQAGFVWIEGEYSNLRSTITVTCEKGHDFQTSVSAIRKGTYCPICTQPILENPKENILAQPIKKLGKRVLGIDNATKDTGWAIFEDGKYLTGGVKKSIKANPVERIADMRQWLVSMIKIWEIDVVGLEDVQYQGNPQTLILLAKLLGVLENTVYEFLGRAPYTVSAATWKSYAGVQGKGRLQQKESAQRIAKARFQVSASSDLADAILLGWYVCSQDRFGESIKW